MRALNTKIKTFANIITATLIISISAIFFNIFNLHLENGIYIYISIIIAIVTITTSYILFYKRVIAPVYRMNKTIIESKNNPNKIKEFQSYNDEIGFMIQEFFTMKKRLESDYRSLQQISLTDPLTGISNRRAFFEVSEELLKLTLRNKTTLSLMIIDIDFFKKVNDTYGHLIGDDVLKYVTKKIAFLIRKSDIFARFGGEEFIILLPNTEESGCYGLAQKIRTVIESTPYSGHSLKIPLTISIGVSQLKEEKLVRELIRRADEALYTAKRNGRNRVEIG